MLLSVFERIIFWVFLLLSLQIPVVCAQYLQHVDGIYQTRKSDVEDFEKNARDSEYQSLDAMIDDFARNSTAAVRRDAEKKRQTVTEYRAAKSQVSDLQNGGYYQRLWVVVHNPKILCAVLRNFKPAIPVIFSEFLNSSLIALSLSFIVSLLIRLVCGRAYK